MHWVTFARHTSVYDINIKYIRQIYTQFNQRKLDIANFIIPKTCIIPMLWHVAIPCPGLSLGITLFTMHTSHFHTFHNVHCRHYTFHIKLFTMHIAFPHFHNAQYRYWLLVYELEITVFSAVPRPFENTHSGEKFRPSTIHRPPSSASRPAGGHLNMVVCIKLARSIFPACAISLKKGEQTSTFHHFWQTPERW